MKHFVVYFIILIHEKKNITYLEILIKASLFNNFPFIKISSRKNGSGPFETQFSLKNNILYVNYILYMKENIDYFYFEIYLMEEIEFCVIYTLNQIVDVLLCY